MSDELKQAIRTIVGLDQFDNVKYIVCDVVSVNESSRSCSVTTVSDGNETSLDDVMLMIESDDGFLLLPAVDSTVVVAMSDKVAPFVCFFSEIQKVLLIVGDSSITAEPDKITFNDGSFGGLIKIVDLVSRLNKVENALIELKTKYNTHTHTGVTTGPGTSGPTAGLLTETVTNTVRNDIENVLVVHGDAI